MIWLLLPAAVFGADSKIKRYVEEHLKEHEKFSVCHEKVLIRKYRNRGVAGGSFAQNTEAIEKLTFGMLAVLAARWVLLLFRKDRTAEKLGLALTLGGGLSNWKDRRTKGFVTDYISFCFGPRRFRDLVFNLSDFCIFLGLGITVFWGNFRE